MVHQFPGVRDARDITRDDQHLRGMCSWFIAMRQHGKFRWKPLNCSNELIIAGPCLLECSIFRVRRWLGVINDDSVSENVNCNKGELHFEIFVADATKRWTLSSQQYFSKIPKFWNFKFANWKFQDSKCLKFFIRNEEIFKFIDSHK